MIRSTVIKIKVLNDLSLKSETWYRNGVEWLGLFAYWHYGGQPWLKSVIGLGSYFLPA